MLLTVEGRGAVPPCSICRERPAKFVCQKCGSLVCEKHFYAPAMMCSRCAEVTSSPTGVPLWPLTLLGVGVAVMLIGFLLVALSALLP
ncbi:hypothetical protein B6U99_03655 [Candidatus Geothermarchaeota archaeon ex4572_27]|nr:MAG: hypothetical protein B6U99_03655 [Candidatus Geothermarchaeota archaeon ex4572_27]